jgi:hypothetical protein
MLKDQGRNSGLEVRDSEIIIPGILDLIMEIKCVIYMCSWMGNPYRRSLNEESNTDLKEWLLIWGFTSNAILFIRRTYTYLLRHRGADISPYLIGFLILEP